MKKLSKRLLSAVLSFAIVMTFIPAAFAAQASPYNNLNLAASASSSSTVTWGPWSDWSTVKDFDLIAISVASLTAELISSFGLAPGYAASIAAGVIAYGGGKLSIAVRIRYGNDGSYYYYERETKLYVDGNQFGDVYTDRGKWNDHGGKSLSL